MIVCEVPFCELPAKYVGLCDPHYQRKLRTGDVKAWMPVGWKRSKKQCAVEGCRRKYSGNGFCKLHNERVKKWGDPKPNRPPTPQSGNGANHWKGGEIIQDGRVAIYSPNHPHAAIGGGKYVLRARLVVEKRIGRFLRPEEVVHHKNRNTMDDCQLNLRLCRNQAEHMKLHDLCRTRKANGTYE